MKLFFSLLALMNIGFFYLSDDQIKAEDFLIDDKVKFGTTIEDFVVLYNQPDSVFDRVNDFLGYEYKELYYGHNCFEFIDNKLNGFNLKTEQFYISYKDHNVLINESEDIVRELFERSYEEKYFINKEVQVTRVQFEDSDDYILFEMKDGKVISILTWTDF